MPSLAGCIARRELSLCVTYVVLSFTFSWQVTNIWESMCLVPQVVADLSYVSGPMLIYPFHRGVHRGRVARKGDTEGVVDLVWTGVKCQVWLTVPCVGGQSCGWSTFTGPEAYRVGQPIRQP